MFNREQFGLHHPGNTVPTCSNCNKRRRDENGNYLNWEKHLEVICKENNQLSSFLERRGRIQNHISQGEFKYPQLNEQESHAISVIASSLYENIKTEIDKSLSLYEDLDKAFVKR